MDCSGAFQRIVAEKSFYFQYCGKPHRYVRYPMKTYFMGVPEGPFALFETETFHRHLAKFSRIYLLVGLLEKSLQTAVPPILSSYSRLHGMANWYDALELSQKGENSLRIAINKAEQSRLNRENISFEAHLPLSFWRYLVRRNSYGTLWVPILFEAFPNLLGGFNRNLLWLLDTLDMRLRIIGERLVVDT